MHMTNTRNRALTDRAQGTSRSAFSSRPALRITGRFKAMLSQEIVTLHLGGYSNYVASHFWNLQDELLGYTEREDWAELAEPIDHSVLFNIRETDRQGTVSYRPRALFVDMCGSLGGVRFGGSPGAAAEAAVQTWGGNVERHATTQLPTSRFIQQLQQQAAMTGDEDEAEVEAQQAALEAAARELDGQHCPRSWTDFLKVDLPPASVWTLPGVWQGVTDFGCWGDGTSALGSGGAAGSEARDELLDRVRVLSEECDNMQGFQIFTDDLGGFGSLTHSLLEELRSDFSGTDTFVVSLRQPLPPQPMPDLVMRWTANEALAMAHLPDVCSLYVPLMAPSDTSALSYLRYRPSNPFHTGAILAAAIDAITFPMRLHPGAGGARLGAPVGAASMRQLVQMLRGRGGANLASASMYLPCPPVPSDLHSVLQQADARLSHHPGQSQPTPSPRGAPAPTSAAARSAPGAGGDPGSSWDLDLLSSGLQGVAALTPGLADTASACLAESWVLRGARCTSGEAATTSQALAALDAALMRVEPRRCVRLRCVAPTPVPIPLPFPAGLFAPGLSRTGDLPLQTLDSGRQSAGSKGGPSRAGTGADRSSADASGSSGKASAQGPGGSRGELASTVETCPVLTKLMSTRAFESVLEQVTQRWGGLRRTGAGQALLDSMGYAGAEGQEVGDALLDLAAAYHSTNSDDEGL